jgi:hypothetical protein
MVCQPLDIRGEFFQMSNIYKPRAAALLMVLGLLGAYASGKDKPKDNVITVHGAIMDSQCAYNVHSDTHSHDWMTKRGVQGANNEESCTLHCVKDLGGSYILIVKSDVYKLDDQVKAEQFAGKKVKVSGSIDPTNHTLHVYDMEEDK